jgi:hypothetical protein
MVEMRLAGKTLEEIGAAFGVTRERARQVLVKSGAESVKGIKIPRKPTLIEIACGHCKTTFVVSLTDRRKHCSSTCESLAKSEQFRTITDETIETAIAMRSAGRRWHHIAKDLGASYQGLTHALAGYLFRNDRPQHFWAYVTDGKFSRSAFARAEKCAAKVKGD